MNKDLSILLYQLLLYLIVFPRFFLDSAF